MSGRTIAIGDIHGCSIALAALIDAVDLQSNDTLVTLGDYVDKGLDSKGVLDLLSELEIRCQLIPLLGNHDAVMLGAIDNQLSIEAWKAMGGTATLQSYGESESLKDIPATHVEFLRRCRLWHETPTHIFVHAAYDPELPLDQQDDATLLWQGIRHSPRSTSPAISCFEIATTTFSCPNHIRPLWIQLHYTATACHVAIL